MVYVSTDYVFDGNQQTPYREFDTVNPQSIYGKTKLQGEEIVRQILGRHYSKSMVVSQNITNVDVFSIVFENNLAYFFYLE